MMDEKIIDYYLLLFISSLLFFKNSKLLASNSFNFKNNGFYCSINRVRYWKQEKLQIGKNFIQFKTKYFSIEKKLNHGKQNFCN